VQFLFVVVTITIGFAAIGRSALVICGAVAISMVASALVYISYTNRFLEIGLSEYAWKVLAPGLAPYVLGFALSWLTRPLFERADGSRWKTLSLLAACGTIYMPIVIALLYRLMCDWGEREFLKKQLIHTAELWSDLEDSTAKKSRRLSMKESEYE